MNLTAIPCDKYTAFAVNHFRENGKTLHPEVVDKLYARFDGGTFYLQKVMNVLFLKTPQGGVCGVGLPEKQKQVLIAINKEGQARNLISGAFTKRYGLVSSSSVRSALEGLLDKDFITKERDYYQVYDYFFSIWLAKEGE